MSTTPAFSDEVKRTGKRLHAPTRAELTRALGRRNRAFVCAVLIVLVGAAVSTRAQAQSPEPATHDYTGAGGTLLMVPRDLEMRLAVNALPKPLRDGASVLVLEPTGYIKARGRDQRVHLYGQSPGRQLLSRLLR